MDLKKLNDDEITGRYQRRFAVGAVAVVILAFPAAIYSFFAVTGLFNRPADWISADTPVRIAFDDFTSRFSVTDLVLVSWEGAQLGSPQLDEATRLLRPLCDEEGVGPTAETAATKSLANLKESSQRSITKLLGTLDGKPLHWARSGTEILQKMTDAPASLPRASAIKRLTGSIVGSDGKQTCLVISLNELGSVNRRVAIAGIRKSLALQFAIGQEVIAMAGGPYDGTVIDEASIRSVRTFSPPSAIVAALLCFFCLRSFVLTATITAIAVIGEGLVLTAVYFSGTPMNAVLIVLPPLVFVLTISSGIHLSNYYLDALREFPTATRAQAAAIAMRAGTLPCLMAASTTVVGLGSLTLVRLEPIRIFGIVSVMGLIVTLALLLLVLPGAMLLYGGPREVSDREMLHGPQGESSRQRLRRRLRLLLRGVLRRPVAVIVAFTLCTVALGVGLFSLNTSVNVPRMFDATHPLRTQYDWFEANIGPTVNGELLLRFPTGQIAEDAIDRLELVKEAHVATARANDVGGVLSAISFLPPVSNARGLSATANRAVIRGQLMDPESAIGKLGYLSRDDEAEVWRISFRLPMTTSSDYAQEIEAIGTSVSDAIKKSIGDAKDRSMPEVVLTGGVKVAQEAQEILLTDLFASFLSAFAIVAVVMMFLLRSIPGGLIAMMPNLFPTVGLFGFMGLIHLPLDIGSVMTASVALGIAVDDTIHLLSQFASRTARGLSRRAAAWGALEQCGMAMVHTTLVCGVSLLVYSFSDFVPTRRFAFLMFGLLAMALLGDLLLLPAIMISRLGVLLSKPIVADPGAELRGVVPNKAEPIDARRVPPAQIRT